MTNAVMGDAEVRPDRIRAEFSVQLVDEFESGLVHARVITRNLASVKPSDAQLSAKSLGAYLPPDMDGKKPYADIGLRLRWHRDLLGLDQAQFVKPMPSVKRAAYSNWEAGSTRLSLNGALEIRRTYGLSLDFMYEGNSDALPMSLRQAWLERPLVKNSK